jgi:hypothetical protein
MSLAKADTDLRRVLKRASADEILRVVLTLVASDEGDRGLRADEFADRAAYRQALIDRRRRATANHVAPTVDALKQLALHLRSPEPVSATLVVEGTAAAVRSAMRLPGVLQASLDRPIQVIRPRQTTPESPTRDDIDRYARLVAATQAHRFRWPDNLAETLAREITRRLLDRRGPQFWEALRCDQFGSPAYEQAKEIFFQTAAQVNDEYRGLHEEMARPHSPRKADATNPLQSSSDSVASALENLRPSGRDIVVRRATKREEWTNIAQLHNLSTHRARLVFEESMKKLAQPLKKA